MFSVKFFITGAALALLALTHAPDSRAAMATALDSGYYHHCALTTAGGVLCWGENSYGQLGNGTTINSSVPVSVSGLASGVTQLASGISQACALLTDSSVRCWGFNFYGQLGNGSTVSSNVPVAVTGLRGAIAIAASRNHSCAVMATGGVKCWGFNNSGQLGNGTTVNSSTPVDVLNLTGAVGIVVGAWHACALINNGQVQCWGGSTMLGNGSSANSTTPVNVLGITDATSIVAGWGHTCAKTNTGAAKCWGANAQGQIGNGTTAHALTPVVVSGLSGGVTQLAASSGGYSTCAILTGGSAKCWGLNRSGQLGNGDMIDKTTPTTVTVLTGPIALMTIGYYSACARVNTGVQCWGANDVGQHGAGNTTTVPFAQNVVGLNGAAPVKTPKPLSPVTSRWPVYTWEAIPGASSYRLRVNGLTTVFTAAAVNCPDGVGLCTFRSSYLTPGAYSWQVQGFNEYGDGTWSALIQFLI